MLAKQESGSVLDSCLQSVIQIGFLISRFTRYLSNVFIFICAFCSH